MGATHLLFHNQGQGVPIGLPLRRRGGGLIYGDWAVVFNGTNTVVSLGSDATLDDLPDGAFTVEAWVRPEASTTGTIVGKGASTAGYRLYINGTTLYFVVNAATTAAVAAFDIAASMGKLTHLAGTFDDAGDRKARIYVNGVLKNESGAAVGAYATDAAANLEFGKRTGWIGSQYYNGILGWVRLSNSIRYAPAGFTPPSLMPSADANTVEQWAMNEGSGTTITATVSAPTNNGTLANGSWLVF